MKIAISAKGKNLQSEVDARFARAEYFIIYDTETGSNEAVENTDGAGATHGAGPLASEKIARTGAKAVLTGNCGPNAFRTLKAAGIEVYTGISGTVFEAINDFKQGKLSKADNPSVRGHWR